MTGSQPHFRVEATDHYANLFACLVGQSSRSRKGSSFDYIRAAFHLIDPDWVTSHMTTGLHSGEGPIWNVRDPIFENRENKNTRQLERVMTDSGVDDKRLCVIEPEFAQPLKLMSNPRNILSTVLRCAWDHQQLRTMVKNDPNKASGAHVTVIGHITEECVRGIDCTWRRAVWVRNRPRRGPSAAAFDALRAGRLAGRS
jgi:hypothetical protein